MIDRVRKIVLDILNKENKGWITPEKFNRYANIANLEIFEDYFYQYAMWVRKENQKPRGFESEFADIPKHIAEKIELFTKIDTMTYSTDRFVPPTDNYRIEQLYFNDGVKDIVIDEVPKGKIKFLIDSDLTAPVAEYPVYIRVNNDAIVYPSTIVDNVTCYYIRKPLTPKWTYTNVNGNPIFNAGLAGYQDFEVHPSDEPKLVMKILSYAGVSIREESVYAYAEGKDSKETQKEAN